MEVFWICAVANHSPRLYSSTGHVRQRCTLPPHPFLLTLLEQNNLQIPQQRVNELPSFTLTGLVLAAPGVAANDIIMSLYLHRDELCIWQAFWRDTSDVYTIVAKEIFQFDEPIPVFTCQDLSSDAGAAPMQGRKHVLSPFVPYGVSLDLIQECQGELFVGGAPLQRSVVSRVQSRWSNQGHCSQVALNLDQRLASCSDAEEAAALRMEILDAISFFESGRKGLEWGGVIQQFPSSTLINAVCLGATAG